MLWLLPWEKWLPPYIVGPILFAGPVALLFSSYRLAWWDYVLLPLCSLFGFWGTWVWFKRRENIFNIASTKQSKDEE